MNTILVTAIGSFSSSEVIEKLKKNNRIIGCDIYDRRWLANSNEVDMFYQVPKANKQEEYIRSILEICEKEAVNYIMPLTDVEIDTFNANRIKFDKQNIVVCMSSYNTISICRDKKKTYDFLKNQGICNLIETELLSDVVIDKIKYPVVIKPYNGRSSENMHYINSKEELKYLLENICVKDYIVQEKINGDVVTVDVCRNPQNNNVVCVPRIELLRTLNGAGTSVKILNDKSLIESACRIANKLEICGTVNFEFLRSQNKYYFLECNPRFSGGVGFSGVAGYDFVNNSLNCFRGGNIDSQIELREHYVVKKYIEILVE